MTREVSKWFHEREGELFSTDEHPFDREEIVPVINDSVDPVQQVNIDSGRYMGVIEYTEHSGWYEYIRWDDISGEVTIGVCAQCVKEADNVSEVTFTIGEDTSVSEKKIENHYRTSHGVVPEDIETGATLLDGTTINGNEAIHTGMDGSGSGVDADFVRGRVGAPTSTWLDGTVRELGNIVDEVGTKGELFDAYGVGVDANNSLWQTENTNQSLYKIEPSTGNTITQIGTPVNPWGVAVAPNGSLWFSNRGGDKIYETTTSGNTQTNFASASTNPSGIGVDSNSCIWYVDDAGIQKSNQNGSATLQFTTGAFSPGLSVGNGDCIWISANTTIYKYDQTGSEVKSYPSEVGGTDSDGCGVKLDDEDLWVVYRNDDSIRRIQSGVTKFE